MPTVEPSLRVDLSLAGMRNASNPPCIRLHAERLFDLISDARAAYRVYDLMLIDRPGDVWPWVDLLPENFPADANARIEEYWAQAADQQFGMAAGPGPVAADAGIRGDADRPIPFLDFDRLFSRANWHTDSIEHSWRAVKDDGLLHDYARCLLAIVRNAVERLPAADPLLEHIVSTVRDGTHAFHLLDRARFQPRPRAGRRPQRTHGERFYRKLQKLVRAPDVCAVSYRGDGDWFVLRALATEQRRRAVGTSHSVGHALYVSALTNLKASNDAWASQIWFFSEGLAIGDLHVEERNAMGQSLPELATGPTAPGRYILSDSDCGDIPGWTRSVDEGFVLYTRDDPTPVRATMERVHDRRRPAGRHVLSFGPDANVYSYDHVLVLVGAPIDQRLRDLLARRIASWQNSGGKVQVLFEGDAVAFYQHGCSNLTPLPEEPPADAWEWFTRACRDPERLDVVIALAPSAWAAAGAADALQRNDGLRRSPLWVVATAETPHLRVDHVLSGDLGHVFNRAILDCPRD